MANPSAALMTPCRHPDLADACDVTVNGQAVGVVGRRGGVWHFRTYDGGRGEVASRDAAVEMLCKLAR